MQSGAQNAQVCLHLRGGPVFSLLSAAGALTFQQPAEFGNLQTLRLALSLAERDSALIPEPLQEQVKTIIQQATDIVCGSQPDRVDTWPESIAHRLRDVYESGALKRRLASHGNATARYGDCGRRTLVCQRASVAERSRTAPGSR